MPNLKRRASSKQAPRFFRDLSGPLEIHGVRKVEDVRRENLEILILEYGTMDALAEAANTSSVYLSQVRRQAIDVKTGRPRQMGPQIARRLEAAKPHPKPDGWMDVQRTPEEIEAIKSLIAKQREQASNADLSSLGASDDQLLFSAHPGPLVRLRECPAFLLAEEFDALPEQLADGKTKGQLLQELRRTIARHAKAALPAAEPTR
jgi:hypothetical protein